MAKALAILLRLALLHSVAPALSVGPRTGVASENPVPPAAKIGPPTGKAAPAPPRPRARAAATSTETKRMKSRVVRWAVRGIAAELFHNVFLRALARIRTRLLAGTRPSIRSSGERTRCRPRRELAVVTGATGGIGSEIAADLAFRGYDVVLAARDAKRGEALADEIRGALEGAPVEEGGGESKGGSAGDGGDGGGLPSISFVEYHADIPQSAMDVAASLKDRGSPLTVLINNAGIMGKSKRLTMMVNLIGPAALTLALLPLLTRAASDDESRTTPTVINVGSSAHLRAAESFSSEESVGDEISLIDSLPDDADDDLSVYARSKLALMQFSTLLRHSLPEDGPPLRVLDAHPGLVWTPLLRNHIGDGAVGTLTRTGLAGLIYKSPSEGARAITAALDHAKPTRTGQAYFVNGRPGGYAAPEGASADASIALWRRAIAPEVDGVVPLPEAWDPDAGGSAGVEE